MCVCGLCLWIATVQCGTCIHSRPSLIPPPHLHPHASRVQTTSVQCGTCIRSRPSLIPPPHLHPHTGGGSTGSRTGCNLKTGAWCHMHGWCCMIAFLSCLNFALPILRPILRLCLSLPTLVPQGYSALFVSILSGESKGLITMMKARGVQQ